MMQTNLIGRRAAYLQVTTHWDKEKHVRIETDRKTFYGEVVGLFPRDSGCLVVLLFDDGSLRAVPIDNVRIEATQLNLRGPGPLITDP